MLLPLSLQLELLPHGKRETPFGEKRKSQVSVATVLDYLTLPPVAEAMMNMQHKCLVRFLGAGVMSEPEHGLRMLFTLQV